jgi:GNAT superfamily N-acetyltransferase
MDLQLAVDNATAFWTALGETRGHQVLLRPGFLGVRGSERSGMRLLVRSAEISADDMAELTELARSGGRVVVEDAYGVVDMTDAGMTMRQLPVMIRRPGEAMPAPKLDVVRVESREQLELAEYIVVHGFTLDHLQPYQAGEAFPKGLLDRDDVELYTISREGTPAGACFTVLTGETAGIYWVTTLPEHRSRGVGRELMHAVLADLKDLPVTLTAAKAGKPLYDSLGFQAITQSSWWS